jgi:chorismate mutase/prephenate dehydratase
MDQEQPQSALDEARVVIDEVDRAMADLFTRRMEAVAQVAAYKGERGLPIYDAGREAAVIERNSVLVDEEIRPYYLRFMEATMKESRCYQQSLLQGACVAGNEIENCMEHNAEAVKNTDKEANGHGMD